jgi:ABC-type Fe3+-hydroxamate transport system substrate-binding protein
MKIVSLVPSLTKTICDFGLKDQIVGITNFCVDPPDLYRTATRIGGTKDPDLRLIKDLKPTHVIVNEEENRAEDIRQLGLAYNVLSTFPKSPADVPSLLVQMGDFLGVPAEGQQKSDELKMGLESLSAQNSFTGILGKRFVYLIWRDPWMAAGEDTYISKMLASLGSENIVKNLERYPVVTPSHLLSLRPDVVLMSSEPWPFRKRDAEAWRSESGSTCPPIYWIDGKAMSWYGTTTLDTVHAIQSGRNLIKQL